jgi:2-oxoglutarate ferredoxin oxidoreductase subunit delta
VDGAKSKPTKKMWRKEFFMAKKKRVVINRDWCKGCGICVAFCPKEVLVLDHQEKAEWAHQEKCISCGLCELRCPDLAIELEDMES